MPGPPQPEDPRRGGVSTVSAFAGTNRFKVVDQLGAGAMCVVYRVRDTQHGDIVALKTLRHLDANSLYRLKQEFRALSSIDHPNLVSFYELVHSEQGWFVTMELVEGVDFLTSVRGVEEAQRSRARSETTFSQDLRFSRSATSAAGVPEVFEPLPGGRLPDLVRLRGGLRQLAEGVAALHAAGRVHRDLKPSNVLVTGTGRVVILDFGLVADIDQDYTEGTLHQNIAGSAAYMSPEQSVGHALTEASDWYSVGVMLYEALTGVWPYSGHLYQILSQKQERDPTPPIQLVPGIPQDLNDFCMGLLRRRPSDRPSGRDVIAQLRGLRQTSEVRRRTLTPRFRFRDEALLELNRAFTSAKWGHSVVCLVRGGPGTGKTTLIREFVKQVKRREESVITLKGRCYEWEQVPFKALDGVMDNLSRVLRRLDPRHAPAIQSDDLPLLAALFPVLSRVESIGSDTPPAQDFEPQELARSAFRGLRDLLRGLGGVGPVILSIDDVHWGDTESAEILAEIVKAERSVPMLVLLSYRSSEPSAFVHWLLPGLNRASCDVRILDLEPLTFEQACVVAGEMLARDPSAEDVRAVALESAGNPHQIRELVRRVDHGEARAAGDMTEVVVGAIAGLSERPKALLDLLVVAGQPVSTDLAIHALQLGNEAFPAISTLRAHSLVNATGGQASGTLEVYSDKVREYVLDQLSDTQRRANHLAIASALEAAGVDDPEALVNHFAGGGAHAKAGLVAWLAAEAAIRDRQHREAVWLLDRAIELGEWSARERRSMCALLGHALAAQGRGREAAAAYLRAVEEGGQSAGGTLRVQAAEQLLATGAVSDGIAMLDLILRETGRQGVPPDWAVWAVDQWTRFRSGSQVDLPRAGLVDGDAMLRASALVSLAEGLLPHRPKLSAIFQGRLLGELEGVDELTRLRAVALETAHIAREQPSSPLWRRRWEQVQDLGRAIGTPEAAALATWSAGQTSLLLGAWADAARLCAEAESSIRTRCTGLAWQRFQARIGHVMALIERGDLRTAAARAYPLLAEAEGARNVLVVAIIASRILPVLALAEGELDPAIRQLENVEASWPDPAGAVPIEIAIARAQLDVGRGRAAQASERVEAAFLKADALGAWQAPHLRVNARLWRGIIALHLHHLGDRKALKRAEEMAAALKTDPAPWARPWASLLGAGIVAVRGGAVAAAIETARVQFSDRDMWLGAAIAGRAGAVLANAPGSDELRAWFGEVGMRDPDRWVRLWFPGPADLSV